MKINWALVIFIGCGLILVVGSVIISSDEKKINNQKKDFCEDAGGEYDFGDCLIKENGYYQEYNVRWEWGDEKGVREFFLVRE